MTDSKIPRNYWSDLKRKLIEEGSELHEKIVQLKLKSNKDGKKYVTDTLDTEGILRLIESVPSSKAEPFKLWLASLGKERIDEVFDPEIAVNRAIDYYRNKGYSDKWIEARLKGILDRKKLTDIWKENGIFDKDVFELMIEKVIIGESGADKKANPRVITFILKSENEIKCEDNKINSHHTRLAKTIYRKRAIHVENVALLVKK